MAVYVYLNMTKARRLNVRSGDVGNLVFHMGRCYIILSNSDPVPSAVADIVEEVSLYERVPSISPREAGIYRYQSAEAEVDHDDSGRLEIRVRAANKEDAIALYRMIRTGSLRPEQSYEEPQGGMSRAQLENEVARLKKGENDAFYQLAARLRGICGELDEGVWPFCRKKKVLFLIDTAISGNRV